MQELILGNIAVNVPAEYSSKEKSIIKELTQGATVDVVIPDNIDVAEFDVALSAVCKVIVRAEMQKESLIPVLGRLLYIASTHPETFKETYETFEALVASVGQRFGIGRSTCFEAKGFWERWSAVLPPEEYKTVGRVKLKMISGAVDKGKESQKSAAAAIQYAKEHTADELEEYLEEKFAVEKGSTTGAILKLASNKKQNKLFIKWFEDPRVAAFVGSDDMADILVAMIEYCSSEFFNQGQEKADALAASAEVLNEEQAEA